MNIIPKNISLAFTRIARRLSIKEQASFAARLGFLLGAGIPLLESLYMLQEQIASRSSRKRFAIALQNISNGRSLSHSLESLDVGWTTFSLQLIKIGELSGNLQRNLERLSLELKKMLALRQKVQSALLYPAFIMLSTLGITLLLTIYIFPKILPIFKSIHQSLPLSTRLLIWISDFAGKFGFYAGAALLAVGISAVFFYKKAPKFKYACERSLFCMPFIGPMLNSYHVSHWCRTLSLLLASGLSISESLAHVKRSLKSISYILITDNIADEIIAGKTISDALRSNGTIFPDVAVHLIAIGERAGNLSSTLLYIAEYFENEVDSAAKNLGSAIEPMLMVVMGLVVGFIAISIITPIYQITDHLQH